MGTDEREARREARIVEIALAVLLGGAIAVVPGVALWLAGHVADLGGPGWDTVRSTVQLVTLVAGAAVAVWWLVGARRKGL
jgi:hypothetical protein